MYDVTKWWQYYLISQPVCHQNHFKCNDVKKWWQYYLISQPVCHQNHFECMMSQNGDSITWYPNLYAIKITLNVWCHKMMTVLLDIPACMPLKPPQMYDVTKWWQYYLIPSLYAIKTTSNVWCHKMMTVLLDIPACMPLKPPQMYDVTKWWQYYLISQPVCH